MITSSRRRGCFGERDRGVHHGVASSVDHLDECCGTLGTGAVVEDTRQNDTGAMVEIAVTNQNAFRTYVLGFLDHAEILEPPELRADDRRLARTGRGRFCSGRVVVRAPRGSEIQRIPPRSCRGSSRTPIHPSPRSLALRRHRRATRRRPRARLDDRRAAVLAGRLSRRRKKTRAATSRSGSPNTSGARCGSHRPRVLPCSRPGAPPRRRAPIRAVRSRPRSPSWRTLDLPVSSSTSASRVSSRRSLG